MALLTVMVVVCVIGLFRATLAAAPGRATVRMNGNCITGTKPIMSVNFNNWKAWTAYTGQRLRADFKTEKTNWQFKGTRIVPGYSGNGLEITHPAKCVGSKCTLWLEVGIPEVEEVYVSFRVKLQKGFTFVKGGKLPGICGGDCNSGFKIANGYNGFSSRIMWREGGDLVSYAYHPGQRERYGDDYPWEASVKSGEWVRLSQHIKMNKPGKTDGVLDGYVGTNKVYSNKAVSWRKTKSLKIEAFVFATFFGGDSWQWAPRSAQKMVFDDILVCGR